MAETTVSAKVRKSYDHIRLEIDADVSRIVLCRPPVNVLNIAMMNQITDAILQLEYYPAVKALIFVSDHRIFSAGVDVAEHRADKVFDMLEAFGGILDALRTISVPSIGIIRGMALGGGMELALACDFAFATPDCKFGQPEIKLGIFAPYATVLLTRLVGTRKAMELLLLGEPISGEDAARAGLITRAVADVQLESEVNALLEKLRTLSAPVLRVAVRAIRETLGIPLADALRRAEQIYLNELMELDDAEEGLRSFLEKRKPEWKNR